MSLAQGILNQSKKWLDMVMNSLRFTRVSTAPTGASGEALLYLNTSDQLAAKVNGNTERLLALSGQANSFSDLTLTGATNQFSIRPGGSGNSYITSLTAPASNVTLGLRDPGRSVANYIVDNSGNSATQATNVNTNVLLNARSGYITMQGVISGGATASFNLLNSYIQGSQTIILAWTQNTVSGTDFLPLTLGISAINSGQCTFTIQNRSLNATLAAPVVQFLVI